MKRALILLLTVLLPNIARAQGQEQEPALRRVEARVSGISGRNLYLDRGRDAHIEPGDAVHVLPAGRPRVVAVVESVSRTGCRARLVEADGIAIGDRAEVLVPKARFVDETPKPAPSPPTANEQRPVRPQTDPPPAEPEPAERAVPEHPEWTHPPEEWNEDLPLLAPPESSTPEDREPRLSGRYFLGADHTWDDDQDRRYLLGRTGVDARMENPFGLGGGAKFRAEASQRNTEVENGNDEDESHLRIDRLSWYRGDTRERAGRIELGRFLQDAF
ncbi:MAG: hypothetical protein GY711_19145, partial [bacterium]|nr:hypothetical protein [bacterium]